jgi:hypothetical protein
MIALKNSGHALTVDTEWQTAAELTYRFIKAHLPSSSASGNGRESPQK